LVTINGINFGGATEVTFNFVPSTFTAFGSQIRATVPTGATTGRIRVTTPGGSATSSGDFIVSAAPPPPPPPPPPSGTAQLDLTWDNCVTANLKNGEPAASNGKTFDCSTLNTYRLHGCFKTPVDLPDFFAMDVSMDLQQSAAGALIPFYHYESGGCNASGIALSVDKSTAGALGDGNACANFESPWGALGEQPAFAGITGYAFDFGQPGRGRLLVSISRASDNPVALVANRNYYGFHLRLSTGNREACATCGAPAALVWNSAQLYSTTIPVVTLSGPSAKGTAYCAWIGDAVSGCAATPVRNITWGKLKTMYR
jgi:hypothetical protein